jgi:hypothetical protein
MWGRSVVVRWEGGLEPQWEGEEAEEGYAAHEDTYWVADTEFAEMEFPLREGGRGAVETTGGEAMTGGELAGMGNGMNMGGVLAEGARDRKSGRHLQ